MDHRKDNILQRNFFERDTALVARELLGKMLVRKISGRFYSGIILETEAYYGIGDPASHAFRGMTSRSSIMFGKAGIAYIYLCYGFYWLLNVVTEAEGKPGAVLIRGIKPVEGMEEMKKRRKILKPDKLTDGPGKLTIAMGIDGKDNGSDMTGTSDLYIIRNSDKENGFVIKNTPRVGISSGKDLLLRYVAVGL